MQLAARTVVARNTAADEAGSIHDDAYATQAGYRGGLVPGVTLLANLTPILVEAFGEAWPQRGRLRARFVRPAYDGETLVLRATVRRREDGDNAVDIALDCRLEREDGTVCVEAEAACLLGAAPATNARPWRRALPVAKKQRSLVGDALPPLTPETLVVGEELSPLSYRLSREEALDWVAQVGDTHPWYTEASPFGGPIVQPALFARDPIYLLRHNFARRATIHAETDLTYRGAGWPEREYTVYGYVADVYERTGHGYVVVDSVTVDEDGREIVRNRHTSLIRLRAET